MDGRRIATPPPSTAFYKYGNQATDKYRKTPGPQKSNLGQSIITKSRTGRRVDPVQIAVVFFNIERNQHDRGLGADLKWIDQRFERRQNTQCRDFPCSRIFNCRHVLNFQ